MPPRCGLGLTFFQWVFDAVAVKYFLEPDFDMLLRDLIFLPFGLLRGGVAAVSLRYYAFGIKILEF